MKIRFVHQWPLEETMDFEDVYVDELRTDLSYKQELKDNGAQFIYIQNTETGELIGETYFIEPEKLDELDDLLPGLQDWLNRDAIYVYGTTILPQYQNQRFGKILKAYFLGYVKHKYKYVLGHARDNGSIKLNKAFGAEIIATEPNWQDSGEHVYFYKINL